MFTSKILWQTCNNLTCLHKRFCDALFQIWPGSPFLDFQRWQNIALKQFTNGKSRSALSGTMGIPLLQETFCGGHVISSLIEPQFQSSGLTCWRLLSCGRGQIENKKDSDVLEDKNFI
ncbi:hypothetical protein DdX_09763 [Ditylenchus destructor]|uniref:Uncharacterized protein n=1 Tax=Ditylenchus destructor TaxID=166010 RepID=A0AAD4R628_9BILA|nr:hypothetical protein DdX_09763 [Ditylenchus destructor]